MTVADAVDEFNRNNCSVVERTIQRYCQSGKLDAIKVDPETRQPTDHEPTMFLIDAATVATRIRQLQQNQNLRRPTVNATGRVHGANSHDTDATAPRPDATPKSAGNGEGELAEKEKEIEKLKNQVFQLQVDKEVRSQMVDQLKSQLTEKDRYIEKQTERMFEIGQQLGEANAKLQLSGGGNVSTAPDPAAEQLMDQRNEREGDNTQEENLNFSI